MHLAPTAIAAAAAAQGELSEEQKAAIPPYAEAVSRGAFATQRVVLSAVSGVTLQAMAFVLPPPQAVLNLFAAVAALCNVPPSDIRDASGDVSWDRIKAVCTLHDYHAIIYSLTRPAFRIS